MICNPHLSAEDKIARNKSLCRTYLSRWSHYEYQAFVFLKGPLDKVQTQPRPEIPPLEHVNFQSDKSVIVTYLFCL